MSERQAKLKRKNEIKETPKKKKSAIDIIINIIIVVLVLGILAVGGWAIYNKYQQMPQQDTSVSDTAQDAQTTAPTIAEYAQTEEKSVEEFLAEYGLSDAEGISGETLITDIIDKLTLANYAKLSGTDVASLKESLGLSGEYTDDTLMSVIFEEQAAANSETQPEEAAE